MPGGGGWGGGNWPERNFPSNKISVTLICPVSLNRLEWTICKGWNHKIKIWYCFMCIYESSARNHQVTSMRHLQFQWKMSCDFIYSITLKYTFPIQNYLFNFNHFLAFSFIRRRRLCSWFPWNLFLFQIKQEARQLNMILNDGDPEQFVRIWMLSSFDLLEDLFSGCINILIIFLFYVTLIHSLFLQILVTNFNLFEFFLWRLVHSKTFCEIYFWRSNTLARLIWLHLCTSHFLKVW